MSKVFNYSLSRIQKNILKFLVMSISLLIMYFQLKYKGNISELRQILTDVGNDFDKLIVLVVVFMLMYLNWGLEAFKFQYLLRNFNPIKYSKALMATLSGVTFSLFMPNRTGEFIGRVFHLKRGIRIKAVLATVLGSMSQLLVTIFFGLIALLLSFKNLDQSNYIYEVAFYSGLVILVIFVVVILAYPQINRFIVNAPFLKSLKRFLIVFSLYSHLDLSRITAISTVRYLVFSLQFILLLMLFCPEISLVSALVRVMAFFLVQSIIPGTGITELTTRGIIVIALFEGLVENPAALLATTYILWVINLFIPAIIGAVFILTMKLFD